MRNKLAVSLVSMALAVSASCFAAGGGAEPFLLDKVIPEPNLSQLKKDRSIRYVHGAKDFDLKLLPVSEYAEQAAANRTERKSGGYITECLFLVDKKTLAEKSTSGKTPVDTSMAAASRILRSISKMQGMKYYSHFLGKEAVLYSKTYMTAGPDSQTPIPDQNTGDADGQVCYAYQHDRSFGGCMYRIDYHQSGNEIYMTFNNISKMMFGIFKAVDPGQFKANMIVLDCGDQYVVYICTDANCPRVAIINSQIADAFNDRLDALYNWFAMQF